MISAAMSYEQSIADFNHAIALDPQLEWTYAQRGEVYRHLGEYERAIADYNRALAIDPDYFWAYGSRGIAYFSLKQYQRAIADYNHAIALNPSYTWGYAQRGKTYRHLHDYRKAIADFDRAIALDTNDAWVYSHRGLSYAALGEYRKAIEDIDLAIAMNPDYAHAYGHRGSVYLYLKDIGNARADYTHSCELKPTDIRVCWMIEWISMCQQPADNATAQRLERIAAADPRHSIAYVCQGVALWLQGHAEQALVEIQKESALRPTTWDAFFWQGMIQGSLGRREATQMVERALELGMPPALLIPLRWLAHDQPAFYAQYILPLVTRYDV
jgi:tetratricopeptide (TPR) repeat protein